MTPPEATYVLPLVIQTKTKVFAGEQGSQTTGTVSATTWKKWGRSLSTSQKLSVDPQKRLFP
jgi:hypothetical protein